LPRPQARAFPVVVREIGEVGPDLLGYCHATLSQERRQIFDAWHSYLGAAQPADQFDSASKICWARKLD
jgi:hypothetical protein